MDSYDKTWAEIENNIVSIHIGMPKDSILMILGSPDTKLNLSDSNEILSYQQYGVIAPHWVYDIHIENNTVKKIEEYDW
jgi:hypothetical protein